MDARDGEGSERALKEKIDHVLMRSGLREHYANESKGALESRVENLDELVSVASRFVRGEEDERAGLSELVAFLAYAALEAGEGQAQAGEDGVQRRTLHRDRTSGGEGQSVSGGGDLGGSR